MRSAAALIGGDTARAKIASGRPDANGLAVAGDFGRRSSGFIREDVSGKLELKGNYPFPWNGFDPQNPGDSPSSPRLVTNEACSQCRLCSRNRPWEAMDRNDSRIRDYSNACSATAV